MSDQMSGHDPYVAVLADLKRRREEIDNAIKVIEAVRGGAGAGTLEQQADATPNGQFLGMSIAEAAKIFLKSKRRTLSSLEIADGLILGGVVISSAEPGNVINSVLTRRFNGPGDIVRVHRGQWGLKEWYPGRTFQKKEEPQKVKSETGVAGMEMPPEPEEGVALGS